MTQLALFAKPEHRPATATDIVPDFVWVTAKDTKPGRTIRKIRVKSTDGASVVVCPCNFVDEAWPWTGRKLTADELRADWTPTGRKVV